MRVDGPRGRSELTRETLVRLADPEAAERAGPWGAGHAAVPVAALIERTVRADHATFHAADGYAASLPLSQALADAIVLVPPDGSGKVGVRLVVADGTTTCLNVKAVTRIELTRGPGKHTVDPDPHENAFVPSWDDAASA